MNKRIAVAVVLMIMITGLIWVWKQGYDKKEQVIQALTYENQQLVNSNTELTSNAAELKKQLSFQQDEYNMLTSQYDQLKEDIKTAYIDENVIQYDLRVPTVLFEIIKSYVQAMNNKDSSKLAEFMDPNSNVYRSTKDFIESNEVNKREIKAVLYQMERTFKSDTKTTEVFVINVDGGDQIRSFAFSNTNNDGWILVDID